jgi:hypothetical protein
MDVPESTYRPVQRHCSALHRHARYTVVKYISKYIPSVPLGERGAKMAQSFRVLVLGSTQDSDISVLVRTYAGNFGEFGVSVQGKSGPRGYVERADFWGRSARGGASRATQKNPAGIL